MERRYREPLDVSGTLLQEGDLVVSTPTLGRDVEGEVLEIQTACIIKVKDGLGYVISSSFHFKLKKKRVLH